MHNALQVKPWRLEITHSGGEFSRLFHDRALSGMEGRSVKC